MIPKFEKDEFYINEFNLETCMEVVNVQKLDGRAAILDVIYWQIGYAGKPWRISKSIIKVIIAYEDFDQWQVVDCEDLCIPRPYYGGLR